MNMLVTGGGGFIGRHVVRRLCDLGHTVTIVDNWSAGRPQEIVDYRSRRIFQDIAADDMPSLVRAIAPEVIVHLAAQSSLLASVTNPGLTGRTNVDGTRLLLEAADHVKHVVFASTGAIYDPRAKTPYTEDSPVGPSSLYGATKVIGEELVRTWAADGRTATILRFGNVYGPEQLPVGENQVVPRALRWLLDLDDFAVYGNGWTRRDYIHVANVVRAIERAIERRAAGTYTIGTGNGTTTNHIVSILAQLTGQPFRLPRHVAGHDFEHRAIVLDTRRAMAALDWFPTGNLVTGLQTVVDWARALPPDHQFLTPATVAA